MIRGPYSMPGICGPISYWSADPWHDPAVASIKNVEYSEGVSDADASAKIPVAMSMIQRSAVVVRKALPTKTVSSMKPDEL